MSGTSEWLIKLSLLSRKLHHSEERKIEEKPRPNLTPAERKQTVIGKGHIPRDPINKQAAMLLAKANWLSQPPAIPLYEKKTTPQPKAAPTRKKKKMKGTVSTNHLNMENRAPTPKTGKYTSEHGFTVHMVNGEPFFNIDELQAWIVSEVPKLIPSINPAVQQAKDARAIIDELLRGMGGEMEQFKLKTKDFIEDVRQSRFAAVAECSQMTTALRDVRQFFLGSDYKEQIERLREFVELCERLNALKASGFLDKVADTMLSLAVNK